MPEVIPAENENCLQGMSCPKCGYNAEVYIQVQVWKSLLDDGSDDCPDPAKSSGDCEFDHKNLAACPECRHEGHVGEWSVEEVKSAKITVEKLVRESGPQTEAQIKRHLDVRVGEEAAFIVKFLIAELLAAKCIAIRQPETDKRVYIHCK